MGKKQGQETWFGIGVTNTWFQNIEKGNVELFTRKHMQHSTKLGDMLGNYEMVSTLHGDISTKPFCIPYVNPITACTEAHLPSPKQEHWPS
ncbi:MAG TPA: hypothetical protein ENI20_16185 [Bacteroides sp.]|nr:hypothetical protein [Bacteroides sp.]